MVLVFFNFFKIFFFWRGPFLKSFLNLLQYYFFFVWFFWLQDVGPQPGIESTPLALKGEILTTGPPEKAPTNVFYYMNFKIL